MNSNENSIGKIDYMCIKTPSEEDLILSYLRYKISDCNCV